jgi:hypothetical protein
MRLDLGVKDLRKRRPSLWRADERPSFDTRYRDALFGAMCICAMKGATMLSRLEERRRKELQPNNFSLAAGMRSRDYYC